MFYSGYPRASGKTGAYPRVSAFRVGKYNTTEAELKES